MRNHRRPANKAVEVPEGPDTRLIGYARVSTADQNVQAQIDALLAAGVRPENIHHESVSGAAKKRPGLELAFLDARAGDTVIVWKLDRLGRNLMEVLQRLQALDERGIYFKSLTDSIDTSSMMGKAIGKLTIAILGAVAEFERELTRERTRAGMRAHKARGGRIGAPRKLDAKQVTELKRLRKEGAAWHELAERFDVSKYTVQRYAKNWPKK